MEVPEVPSRVSAFVLQHQARALGSRGVGTWLGTCGCSTSVTSRRGRELVDH